MIRKDRYWVLKNEEMDVVIQLLQTHPAMLQLQQGSAINSIFAAMNKALAEKEAAEQQPIQDEPDAEPVYAQHGRNIQPNQAPQHPPRRGVAAKVSQTQPMPPPPLPPNQKKKPQFVTRQAPKEEVETESQEEEESDDGNEVEGEDLLDSFSDEDF